MKKTNKHNVPCVLDVRLLGSFRIWAGQNEITGARARSSLMWKLFRYFMLNRDKAVSTSALINVLWPNGECDDPLRALYTLVYRLRGALNKGVGGKRDFFVFKNDSYTWNGEDLCEVDLDEFTGLCEEAKSLSGGDAVERLERAVALYSGDLFADSRREEWMLAEVNEARARYCEAAARLINLYLEADDYEAACKLSERALSIDSFDENFHLGLLKALMGLSRNSLALAHYEYYAAMIYNESGEKPSERFDELYESMHQTTSGISEDIDAIMQGLDVSDTVDSGPIYCDIDTFTKIYNLERRIIERTNQPVFLVCVRFKPAGDAKPTSGELSEMASLLKRVTIFGLRRSDVVTQLSGTQLLMLLMNVSYENCNEVVQRFEKQFLDGYHGAEVKISHDCRPLRAAREEI